MNLDTLRKSVRYAVFADPTEDTYADSDLDRNINLWYKTAISWILPINGDWQVNGEIATKNTQAGQNEYLLPTDILKLNQVYVKPSSDSEYLKAEQIDPHNVAYNSPSDSYNPYPPTFDLLEKSIIIYVADGVQTVEDGIKIYYQTEISELSNTTDEITLAPPFEKVLIEGAKFEFFNANGPPSEADRTENRLYNILKPELQNYYSNRSEVKKIKMTPHDLNNENNY